MVPSRVFDSLKSPPKSLLYKNRYITTKNQIKTNLEEIPNDNIKTPD